MNKLVVYQSQADAARDEFVSANHVEIGEMFIGLLVVCVIALMFQGWRNHNKPRF